MSDKVYIMKRTEIPCPNCMKRKVIQETATTAYCDECGQNYDKKVNENSLMFTNG